MVTEHVKAEISDGVLTLKLQRPEKKNALTGVTYNALSDVGQLFKERLKTLEAREAFAAFAERRPLDFSKVA